MSKTVYSYQEVGYVIDRGGPASFTCHPRARVTVRQLSASDDAVEATIALSIGDTCVGMVECSYASITDLLDAFQVDDLDEIWERDD